MSGNIVSFNNSPDISHGRQLNIKLPNKIRSWVKRACDKPAYFYDFCTTYVSRMPTLITITFENKYRVCCFNGLQARTKQTNRSEFCFFKK